MRDKTLNPLITEIFREISTSQLIAERRIAIGQLIAKRNYNYLAEEDWHMPIESSQYFIILFRVNKVFTFYHIIIITSFIECC